MKLEEIEQLEFKMSPKKENELYKCSSCGKMEKKLYQKNICKSCLVKEFKLYIKIIDSVRK